MLPKHNFGISTLAKKKKIKEGGSNYGRTFADEKGNLSKKLGATEAYLLMAADIPTRFQW